MSQLGREGSRTMGDQQHFVASREQAARIAGVTVPRVDYWSSTGIIRPTVDTRLTPHSPIRLFSFAELMGLMVAAELRRRGVSLQHIRVIIDRLREQGYESPLTELVYATSGRAVYFQHTDGSWEGDRLPHQSVMHQVIDLEHMRLAIAKAAQREESTVGHIERRRGSMGGKELVAGTRVPVATVRRYLEHGSSPAEVIEAFPALRLEDVKAVVAVGA